MSTDGGPCPCGHWAAKSQVQPLPTHFTDTPGDTGSVGAMGGCAQAALGDTAGDGIRFRDPGRANLKKEF